MKQSHSPTAPACMQLHYTSACTRSERHTSYYKKEAHLEETSQTVQRWWHRLQKAAWGCSGRHASSMQSPSRRATWQNRCICAQCTTCCIHQYNVLHKAKPVCVQGSVQAGCQIHHQLWRGGGARTARLCAQHLAAETGAHVAAGSWCSALAGRALPCAICT